jgi:hypothetical protein
MAAKLRIDLSQGILEVEGDEAFIREVHAEFKSYAVGPRHGKTEEVRSQAEQPLGTPEPGEDSDGKSSVAKRSSPRRRRSSSESLTSRDEPYTPRVVRDFDPSGLREFFVEFAPESHSDRILIFAKFLQERGQETCRADEIYTCYFILKERLPKRWWQSFIDARGKRAFIDYSSPEDIRITPVGENHFNHDLKRASQSK